MASVLCQPDEPIEMFKEIGLINKSHNAPVLYPTMYHS